MGPLTVRVLLERGQPKSDRLGRIRSLDLSGMELLSEHLDPKLLCRLTQLQELDLSNNQLEVLPTNLGLSHLRILRCANNQLGDVTALCQFLKLEELSLEGNPFLTVNDNLKVSFLLPKLRKINGKDASLTCSQVENLNRELTNRVTAHWEKFIAALGPEEKAEKVQADFVKSAIRHVHYGPESLSEFTQWRVQMISEELAASGGTRVSAANIPEKTPGVAAASRPRVRLAAMKRLVDVPLKLSPTKRMCVSLPDQVEGGPAGLSGSQPALQMEPLYFLQCHSRNNSPQDLKTQLWACAFEPTWEEGRSGATSQTVATCGGEAVCVIDCQTGIVLHKYKAPGEEFFSVAWTALTVVTQAGHKKRWSVLAAAGLRGQVRLLHVRAGFCCGVIRAHKKAIATLCFSPTHETHLFTASYDKRIILWDIGMPNHDYEFQASQLLTLDSTSIPLRLCPVASCPDTHLLAGCEGGCCCWDVRLDQPQKRRGCEVEFVFCEGSASTRRVDGLAFVNEDVVGSTADPSYPTDQGIVLCGDEEGSVWVYDVRHLLKQLSPPPAAPQAPTQILKWPQPGAGGQPVTKTMVNMVVANAAFTYLAALTDSNIVAIWRRC
ncbi:leucine-rich repeat and WD repeat-containing protein 1 isoform X2 [Fukomys damarensis]|uniref:leucine-rich repeat and WD repeat-containing protein 1 isoform X2 n=1 Tax=Fukomys damarensis TaxID=885580 RepID=UPI00053FE63E|nr:leucine-rich repeat and WD repeat-containing protein 1 isoform X2 [Fukomys damarensis]